MKFEKKLFFDLAENSEIRFYKWVYRGAGRLLHAAFLFKRQKGEILAGSVTFFAILSFCPLILMAISLSGIIINDPTSSKEFVMKLFSDSIPNLAPWILSSMEKIVKNHVENGGVSIANSALLFYSLMSVVSTVIFGINYISKTKPKGGVIIEDLKSAMLGGSVGVFLVSLIVISQKTFLLSLAGDSDSAVFMALSSLMKYNFLSIITSLVFFTCFYKYATSRSITTRDAFKGALTFVGCFLIGKSFYWVYFEMFKSELEITYGNFFTIFTAVLWIYYLTCSFFYGASTAYVKGQEVFDEATLFQEVAAAHISMTPSPSQNQEIDPEDQAA